MFFLKAHCSIYRALTNSHEREGLLVWFKNTLLPAAYEREENIRINEKLLLKPHHRQLTGKHNCRCNLKDFKKPTNLLKTYINSSAAAVITGADVSVEV